MAHLRQDSRLADLPHKESWASKEPFYRLKVRLKKEIVTLGVPGVSPTKTVGQYVNPQEWNQLIQDPDVVLIGEVRDAETVAQWADVLQVGARNMQNFMMLEELGRMQRPVLLKRGLSAKLEEVLSAAEYILKGGNRDVILCERGIRTFETYTRNTLDLEYDSAAPEPEAAAGATVTAPRTTVGSVPSAAPVAVAGA